MCHVAQGEAHHWSITPHPLLGLCCWLAECSLCCCAVCLPFSTVRAGDTLVGARGQGDYGRPSARCSSSTTLWFPSRLEEML